MEQLNQLRENIQRVFMGHARAVDQVITCVMAQGHVLIEDVPGVGKTILATSLARSLDVTLSRIQLTPDMLPSDILGVSVWDQSAAQFVFKPGPIFANIILADEPTGNLDAATGNGILDLLAEFNRDGQTLVMVTHDPKVARRADRCVELVEGRIRAPKSSNASTPS